MQLCHELHKQLTEKQTAEAKSERKTISMTGQTNIIMVYFHINICNHASMGDERQKVHKAIHFLHSKYILVLPT